MGLIRIMERSGSDYHEFKKAVKMAKKAVDMICDLTEDMEEEYGYSERGGYSRRDDNEEMEMRGGMGRRYR